MASKGQKTPDKKAGAAGTPTKAEESPDKRDQPKSVRRSMTKRNSVIDLMDSGQQAITTTDGAKYIGAWKDGKMHGEGSHPH